MLKSLDRQRREVLVIFLLRGKNANDQRNKTDLKICDNTAKSIPTRQTHLDIVSLVTRPAHIKVAVLLIVALRGQHEMRRGRVFRPAPKALVPHFQDFFDVRLAEQGLARRMDPSERPNSIRASQSSHRCYSGTSRGNEVNFVQITSRSKIRKSKY